MAVTEQLPLGNAEIVVTKKKISIPKTLTIEDVAADFISPEYKTILASPDPLRRMDLKGSRYYYRINEETNKPTFYYSVTSFSSAVLPEQKFLTDWRVRLGKAEASDAMNVAASYGTFLHIIIGEFLKDGIYDHNQTVDKLADYMKYEGIADKYYNYWMTDLQCDMLSFAQFCFEKEVVPIAIEYPLAHEVGLCGTIDLICEIKFNNKKVKAIVDFKSGRKGFFQPHELQLHTYKKMWNDTFESSGLGVTHVFNWSPTAWRKEPTFKLENQTKSIEALQLPHYLELFKNMGLNNPSKTFKQQTGVLELGQSTEGKFNVTTLEEIALSNLKKSA